MLAAVVVPLALVAQVRSSAPDATAPAASGPVRASRVLAYLQSISGREVVSGQHNREPLSRPTQWTDTVRGLTGASPGLYGADFAFTDVPDRQVMVDAALAQWRAGSLVTLMWHMCPPGKGQTCDWTRDVQGRLSDAQWTELVTDGSPLNRAWKAQIDAVVPYLQQLRRAGVEVLWRPVHELNADWAWWSGRPGPDGSRRLFQLMHDYLDAKGLDNLVWVWSVKDVDVDHLTDYYPGDRYVDVVGLDSWMTPFPRQETYQRVQAVAGPKPVALTEVGTLPTPEQLRQQPRWAYFMVWAEMLTQRSSAQQIRATYADPRVIDRRRVVLPPPGR